jgi:glycosyltransferase involved in cell wall biosynthesis
MPVRYGSCCEDSGYGAAAARCIEALLAARVDVAWEPIVNTPYRTGRARERLLDPAQFGATSFLADLQREPAAEETLVMHTMPIGMWREARDELSPRAMIGHFVWESEQVPDSWRAELAVPDELWVPTEWNARVFRAGGHGKPVHVVPHVTAPFVRDRLDVDDASLPVDVPDDHVVFVMTSAWDWRKRPDRTIDAFLTAFDADDPVTLVVKSRDHVVAWADAPGGCGSREVWRQVMHVVKRHPRPANVVLDTMPWTEAEMFRMLVRADCYVSLTSTEGWGLGAFDAACVGTPVLITGYGGQVEWLGVGYPGLLPFVLEPVVVAHGTSFEPGMLWAAPDLEAAVEAMRAMAHRQAPELSAAAAALGPALLERYSPAAVGAIAASVLP